jgi:hypothetical protein
MDELDLINLRAISNGSFLCLNQRLMGRGETGLTGKLRLPDYMALQRHLQIL